MPWKGPIQLRSSRIELLPGSLDFPVRSHRVWPRELPVPRVGRVEPSSGLGLRNCDVTCDFSVM